MMEDLGPVGPLASPSVPSPSADMGTATPLREAVARLLVPAAFENADDGFADREDREEISGALETADAILGVVGQELERLKQGLRERGLWLGDEEGPVDGALNSLDEIRSVTRRPHEARKLSESFVSVEPKRSECETNYNTATPKVIP